MIFSYEPYKDGIRLTDYQGEEENLFIPETIDGRTVRSLGSGMFFHHRNEIHSMHVPGCVKVMESNALEGCQYLDCLEMEEGMEVLERNFAEMTNISSLRIPSTVKEFDHPMDCSFALSFAENGFYFTDGTGIYRHNDNSSCSFCGFLYDVHPEDYTVLDGTETILADAFHGEESLQHLSLPSSIHTIAEGALCTSAFDFHHRKALRNITAADGALYIQDSFLILRKAAGSELILYLEDQPGIKMPAVQEISSYAFCNQNIAEFRIPSSVKKIHPDAFYGCPLTCVFFESSDSNLYFPLHHQTLREELMDGFGRNNLLFDYAYYDQKICQKFLSAERVRLMVQRLYQPAGLSSEMKDQFTSILSGRLLDAVKLAAERADDQTILHMQKIGLIHSGNLDQVVQILAELKRTSLTAALLNEGRNESSGRDLIL